MSYSCLVSFKKMAEEDIIPFLREYKKATTSRLADIARENWGYCPHLRNTLKVPEELSAVSDNAVRESKHWAKNIFQYKYYYDTGKQLLCLFGVPNCMRDLFDATVHFQNSCDQDYEREVWEGVEAFEQVFDKWASKSKENIEEMYLSEYGIEFRTEFRGYDEGELEREYDYCRRAFAYKEIWASVSPYLYGDEDAIYFSLYGPYEVLEIISFVKHCHNACIEWLEKENL